MPYNVLLVTSQAAFGELIRLTLEETGLYRVRQVKDSAGALGCIQQNPYNLAILDANLENQHLDQLASEMRAAQPGIKLMAIPPENNPLHPQVERIKPDKLVFEPFFAPDLLDSISGILDTTQPQVDDKALPPQMPPWLSNLSAASQMLKDLLPSTEAHTALLINIQSGWISTGSLAQGNVREICASLVRSSFKSVSQSDIARYMKLRSDNSEHLIYATPLASGVLMALVFPPSTPVTKINSQTRRTSQRLTQQLVEQNAVDIPPAQSIAMPASVTTGTRTTADLAFDAVLARLPGPGAETATRTETRYRFPWVSGGMQPAPVPTQEIRPQQQTPNSIMENMQTNSAHQAENLPDLPFPYPGEAISRPPRSIEDTVPSNAKMEGELRAAARAVEDTVPNLARLEALITGIPRLPEESRLIGVKVSRRRNTREFAELIHTNQAYTCLLVPGLTTHRLNGELGERLAEWIPQLCMAFGWKLEGLVVQRQYLQWSVEVPPAISPGNVVRVIRQQTSQHIYNTFSYVSLPRPGEDFWAPGYLVLSGLESPSIRTVSEFIHQTRRRQALPGSPRR